MYLRREHGFPGCLFWTQASSRTSTRLIRRSVLVRLEATLEGEILLGLEHKLTSKTESLSSWISFASSSEAYLSPKSLCHHHSQTPALPDRSGVDTGVANEISRLALSAVLLSSEVDAKRKIFHST
ncbi:hypothetical protein ILYODFUR_026002 [Ilyodon furcidens]|uniref:Uncharacterized protein n=1 Tax=Ilyodon furcidens TaxID=33524 RepID=A0ABV0TNN3_9TELE